MGAASIETSTDRREGAGLALSAFFEIAEKWRLLPDEQIAILGHPARSTYFKWKKEGGLPPRDTLDRISLIIGIYKALHILFTDDQRADSWIRKPNNGPMFNGNSAADFMVHGGLIELHRVRQYIDAQRGGWS